MLLVRQSVALESITPNAFELIERAGRVCYKSESKITHDFNATFIKNIIAKGHFSVLEHASATLKFIVDRGVSHEIVRHRIASYSQESTRYCKYSDHVMFVIPSWVDVLPGVYAARDTTKYNGSDRAWLTAMYYAESFYKQLLEAGKSPQDARAVLPNSLKTELYMTANMREWRHFFELRTSTKAHPMMRVVANEALSIMHKQVPILFADLFNNVHE